MLVSVNFQSGSNLWLLLAKRCRELLAGWLLTGSSERWAGVPDHVAWKSALVYIINIVGLVGGAQGTKGTLLRKSPGRRIRAWPVLLLRGPC